MTDPMTEERLREIEENERLRRMGQQQAAKEGKATQWFYAVLPNTDLADLLAEVKRLRPDLDLELPPPQWEKGSG